MSLIPQQMARSLLVLISCSLAQEPTWAEAGMHWTAYSRTAKGVTGDAFVSSDSISFEDGQTIRLIFVESKRGVTLEPDDPIANVYRVAPIPATSGKSLKLCGPFQVTHLAIVEHDVSNFDLMMIGAKHGTKLRMLVLTAFTGEEVPKSGSGKDRICASFGFTRNV